MVFENLKVKPLQRATSTWANSVVDALEMIYGFARQGAPDNPFYELYGHYGYFYNDLYVGGKRVLRDEDPINLYSIMEPAKQDLKEVIDQSLLTQYMRDTRDVVVRLRMDMYGNVGVIISEPIDEYGRLKTTPKDIEEDLEAATGIINVDTETSPKVVITPPSGKRIDVRKAFLGTNSTSGKIYARFQNSGKIITAIYPSKYGHSVLPAIRIPGDIDDPVVIEWSDTSSGSEIAFIINYKII